MTLEEARAFFSKDRYAAELTGIVIDEIGERYAKCSLEVDARHKNALGFLMGGVAYTLADYAFAVATKSGWQDVTVTTVSEISYFGPCKGGRLIGECRCLKDGKRVCFYRVDISDELGNPVASVSTSGTHLGGK